MRTSALALLFASLGFVSIASHAAACKRPVGPSAEERPSVFLAVFLADTALSDLYPLCGHPKIAVVGAVSFFGPVTYTFAKDGRPLSRGVGGAVREKYMYDAAGRLVEKRTVNSEGDITGRQLYKWVSPYEYTAVTLDTDGRPQRAPAHGLLDVASRTITIRAGGLSVVHQFDAHWNYAGSKGESISFVIDRDAKGRKQREWKITAKNGRQPMARYRYSGLDSKGNPTALAEDSAVMQYGVVRWKPGEKETVRVAQYW